MAKPNEPEKPEPSGFLGDLDAKLAALQALRDSYVRAVSVGARRFGAVFLTGFRIPHHCTRTRCIILGEYAKEPTT